MWKIKQIFDGDYGCEETCSETGQAKEPMVSVTLVEEDTGENGKEPIKYVTVPDRFLTEHGLEEGSDWRLADQKPPKEYAFWGWENANVLAVSNDYPGIRTPWDLYDALSEIWCSETCAPRMRDGWTKENKTLGQCSITAFLAQDIFGGNIVRVIVIGVESQYTAGKNVHHIPPRRFHNHIPYKGFRQTTKFGKHFFKLLKVLFIRK